MNEEKVNEKETRKKLESLESERKEKERKLAVVEEARKGENVIVGKERFTEGTVLYGTYDTCDTCEMCSVDEPPEFVDTTMAAKRRKVGRREMEKSIVKMLRVTSSYRGWNRIKICTGRK